jgi:hypothetical protein
MNLVRLELWKESIFDLSITPKRVGKHRLEVLFLTVIILFAW